MGMKAVLPRATRQQVVDAVADLEGEGPVASGRIGVRVAEMLGVEVGSQYEVRHLISHHGLQTELRLAVNAGELVRRTEAEWQRVAGGQLFARAPSATTFAYATPQGARLMPVLAEQARAVAGGRVALARQWASRQLEERHAGEHAILVAQYLEANPGVTSEL